MKTKFDSKCRITFASSIGLGPNGLANRLPVKMYPNPFQTSTTIEPPGDTVRTRVFVLYNMQGQIIREISFSGLQFSIGKRGA